VQIFGGPSSELVLIDCSSIRAEPNQRGRVGYIAESQRDDIWRIKTSECNYNGRILHELLSKSKVQVMPGAIFLGSVPQPIDKGHNDVVSFFVLLADGDSGSQTVALR